MTDLSSQVPSDGVAKEQAVSALSTVEEVEQGALESFSKFTQMLIKGSGSTWLRPRLREFESDKFISSVWGNCQPEVCNPFKKGC